MAKISRKQLFWILVAASVALLGGIFTMKTWAYYRLLKTGNISSLSILGFQDKITRGSAASAGTGTAPAWANDAPALGDAAAPVELIEFADFGCPYSKDEATVLRELLINHPAFYHLQFRNFPIVDLHPGADLAAAAGVCANAQGKFWAMHDKLFANQGTFTMADLEQYAGAAGLDTTKFKTCMASPDTMKKVNDDIAAGKAGGVTGTPTFFVNGVKIEGAVPSDVWEKIPALK